MTAIDPDDLVERCESDLIPKAERLFGPRSPDWTLGAIRRKPSGDYPQIHLDPESRYVDILLSSRFEEGNFPAVLYELAHECVHVLDPNPIKDNTYLCEGLASWFQVQVSDNMRPTDPSYVAALEAVERLMPRLRDAIRHRRVRRSTPMHRIRIHHLEPFFLNLTPAMAEDLRLLERPFRHG